MFYITLAKKGYECLILLCRILIALRRKKTQVLMFDVPYSSSYFAVSSKTLVLESDTWFPSNILATVIAMLIKLIKQ